MLEGAQTVAGVKSYTAPVVYDANTTISAGATQTQAGATALTGEFNNVTTCGTDGDGVKLPTAVAGQVITVKNSGAASLAVWPATDDSINALAADLSVNIPVGGTVTFTAISAAVWETQEVFVSHAPTTQKGEFVFKAVDNDGDTVTTLSNAAMGQATVISIPDPGAATANILLTDAANDQAVVTATAVELNYLDITTLGTGAAEKAVVLDAGDDYTWPNAGVLTLGNTATAVESAEHGAGAIGTSSFGAPQTYRWIDKGVIITQIKVDLTGLRTVATANDVVALQAGGAAYIGRNVVATNGVVFKTEWSCIETPVGGDLEVNVVTDASAAIAYDGAGGTSYISDSGVLIAGQTIQNLVPALTEGDYIYMTGGAGTALGDYSAGMFILTLYGHALLA